MTLATLTTKGQVTIPKNIRDTLKLRTGDKLDIIATKKNEAIIRPVTKTVEDVFGILHRPGQKAVSLEEMDEAVAERMREKFA